MTLDIAFDNSFARLPSRFYATAQPEPSPAPQLIRLNAALASELGLDPAMLASEDGVAILSGRTIPDGAAPIALAYAGHQFGQFVPALGDGRAILLGEVIDIHGHRRDIQLKGSGRTVFSRRGDGKAALGPVLREYAVSEAMAALGIPTTRSLAAVATGGPVWRERSLPGAMITRVALSHVRVGTFQYFASRGDHEGVTTLADHVIERLYPEAAEAQNPYFAFFNLVVERQARLIASWLHVGFIHGVMNTDNMAVSGETIDYGPCAFLDAYDPAKVFSSIDQFGRYAYGNQPQIGQWNLARLAECLLPLFDADRDTAVRMATDALGAYASIFESAYRGGLARKIGFASVEDGDERLIDEWLAALQKGEADFTLAFRALCTAAEGPTGDAALLSLFSGVDIAPWLTAWRARLSREDRPPEAIAAGLRRINPAIIPRNHVIEQVIAAAIEQQDYAPFHRLVEALARPYDDVPAGDPIARPPRPEERVLATFCGT